MQNTKNKEGLTKSVKRDERNVLPERSLWVHWHALNQHWLSDIQFYEDELSFFRILIDKHLALLIDQKNIDQTRPMISHVQGLEKLRGDVEDKIKKHIKHIGALIENPFAQNAQDVKDEHETIETKVLEFVKNFQSVKREVFKLTEQIIRTGRVTKLLG